MVDRATAAYVRVSRDSQETARQEKRISATGIPIAFWFRDAVGKNPRDLPHKRAEFQRMLKAVEAGLIDKIIVDKQDRFGARDAHQLGAFFTLLKDNHTTLVDADGKVLSGDDDASVLMSTVGALTSTREQKEKAHRNITAKVGKAKDGEYQGGLPPYGFDVACFGADGKEKWRTVYLTWQREDRNYKRLKVYPNGDQEVFDGKDNSPSKDPTDKLFLRPSIKKDRIKIAGQMFGWYADESISPRQIAVRLGELGVDPIAGKHWDKIRIRQMLGNPAYTGFPTWNKNGSARFVEYVDGKFQEVQDKKGKKRPQSDYVMPAKPLYKPLVPQKTWDKVQAKLEKSSEEFCSVPKRSPDTAELYLRPFLFCAHCSKPMYATTGRSTAYLQPSYFCSTYGKYGPKNPSGCHCHRVKHDILERIVKAYLKETQPKVVQLLEAADTGDLEAARPLLDGLAAAEGVEKELMDRIIAYVDNRGNDEVGEIRDDVEVSRLLKKHKGNWVEVYGLLYERFRPEIESSIKEKEAALDTLLDEYVGLPATVKERMNKRMEALQKEIDRLKEQLRDLRTPWANLREELVARQKAVSNAVKVLGKETNGRQKTEALRGVIKEIRCTFKHAIRKETGKNGKPNMGKSYLETVEIVPISGETVSFTVGIMPGPG